MRQTLNYLLIIFLFSCNSKEPDIKNDLERLNLSGRVKTMASFTYEAKDKFGEIMDGDFDEGVSYLFSENGKTDEFNTLTFDSSIISKSKISGDKEKFIVTVYDSKGDIQSKEISKLDMKGNLIEVVSYKQNGSIESKSILKNDDKGNQLEQVFYKDDILNHRKAYKYDNVGNQIECIVYNADGTLDYKSNSKYDNKRQLIENSFNSNSLNIITKKFYTYDKKGNETGYKSYDENGKLEDICTEKYDESNNIIEKSWIRPTGERYIYSRFEYTEIDKHKNWTKLIQYNDDEAKKITKRILTYY